MRTAWFIPCFFALAALGSTADATPQGDPPGGPRKAEPKPPPPPVDAPPEEERRGPSRYRDPQGTILVGPVIGLSSGSGVNYGAIGARVGYAVFTGVVPGIQGMGYVGDVEGGEILGTLWLTPPIVFFVVPFLVGEVGYVWQEIGSESASGAQYGAGAGLHFGRPDSWFGLRAGVIYRYLDIGDGDDFFSPLIVGSFRF